jgi:hypothetical protein
MISKLLTALIHCLFEGTAKIDDVEMVARAFLAIALCLEIKPLPENTLLQRLFWEVLILPAYNP